MKAHLATLELSDGGECLSRLLGNYMAELGTPREQQVQALRSFAGLLQSLFQLARRARRRPPSAAARAVTRGCDGCSRWNCWTWQHASPWTWTAWR